MNIPFRELNIGDKFKLAFETEHSSKVLEKIEPIPYGQIEGLLWTAKWVDGEHTDKICVVPTGTDKAPYMVIPLV